MVEAQYRLPPQRGVTEHAAAVYGDAKGNTLFFVSEHRLGFGTHPASNIAQHFSDAILHMFREDMDEADAPFLAAD
eukprot:2709675-Pleurochrysis_carterae.AAC.1